MTSPAMPETIRKSALGWKNSVGNGLFNFSLVVDLSNSRDSADLISNPLSLSPKETSDLHDDIVRHTSYLRILPIWNISIIDVRYTAQFIFDVVGGYILHTHRNGCFIFDYYNYKIS